MIVNGRLNALGEKPMNEVKLFNRVEKVKNVCKADPREINRVKWLTYRTQNQNHEKFEDACVELGFARLPVDDEEEQERERHVVFFDGQLSRTLGYDESNLSFDGFEKGKGPSPYTHTIMHD
jgi:predicted metalloendopeptidase